MAHSLSAKKRVRQNEKRRLRNRRRRAEVKSAVREFSEKLATGDAAAAAESLKTAYKTIDKIAAKGTMHKKAAARRKSQLARQVNALSAK